jgi:type VI secretion system secreted protein VgrG
VRAGTLDARGLARVQGIDPGRCAVTFPDLDEDAWVPIGTTGEP